jgi:autotransporter-associated beta strand protein
MVLETALSNSAVIFPRRSSPQSSTYPTHPILDPMPLPIPLRLTLFTFITTSSLQAQLSLSNEDGIFGITFDETVAGVSNGAWAGNGFDLNATVAGRLDSRAWALSGFDSGVLNFGGTQTTNNTDFTRGVNGNPVTTGGIYAFQGGSIQGRALGVQPTGTDGTPGTITLRIINTTGNTLTGFTFDYTVHVRNDQERSNSFNFAHSANDTTYTPAPSLNLTSPQASDAFGFAAHKRAIQVEGLSLAPGAYYYFRWNFDDVGGDSNRDEFALDDIRISELQSPTATFNYWDPVGETAGLGGSGLWSGNSSTWSFDSSGASPLQAIDATRRVVFAGVPGVVDVAMGAETHAGVEIRSHGYVLQGGTLQLGGVLPAVSVHGGANRAEINTVLLGSAGLRKTGAGRLYLGGQNPFTGTVSLVDGVLEIASDASLGSVTNPISFLGGTLAITADTVLAATRAMTGSGAIEIPAGTTLSVAGSMGQTDIRVKGGGALQLTGATPTVGTLTFEQAAVLSAPNGPISVLGGLLTNHLTGTTIVAAPVNPGSAARSLTVANGDAEVDLRLEGGISGTSASGRLHKTGDGTVEIASTASYAGGVQLGTAGNIQAPGGTLIVAAPTALGSAPFAHHGGTLRVAGSEPVVFPNALQIAGGQSGAGSVFAGAPMEFTGSANLVRTTYTAYMYRLRAETDVTLSGGLDVATGFGLTSGLTISGPGTVFLPKTTNTITEGITVDAGNLSVSGSLSAPTLTVRNGGSLSGATNTGTETGETLGAVVIAVGGTIKPGVPGAPQAALHTKNLTIQSQGTFVVDAAGANTGAYDQIVVTGTVTLGGNLTLTLDGNFTAAVGDRLLVILNDLSDAVSGTFAGLPDETEFTAGPATFRIDYQGGDGNDVALTVVPEPSGALLFSMSLAALLLGSRRRGGRRWRPASGAVFTSAG